MDEENEVLTYTTAPEGFDWFGTRTLRVAGRDGRGKQVRLVASDPSYAESQRDRYASGLYMVATPEEWAKLVSYNLATSAEEGSP